MRAREFIMKDAYSFHTNIESLQQTYAVMYASYARIFERLGLKFRAVRADTGAIGGTGSHEFHVLADSGEDAIAYCPTSDFAANVELAEAMAPTTARADAGLDLQKVATPKRHTITEVTDFLKVGADQVVKTLIVEGEQGLVALLLRGDHELNEVKASKLPQIGTLKGFATDVRIREVLGCSAGSIGPIGLKIPLIADRSVMHLHDFVCGANEDGFHFTGVNFGRDLPEPEIADIRNVVAGDVSPDGQGNLELCRGI